MTQIITSTLASASASQQTDSTILVEGMTCASCVRHVEKALSKVSGVSSATVSLATNKASVKHSNSLSKEELFAAIESAGYHAVNDTDRPEGGQPQTNPFKRPLILAAILTVPIFLLEMVPMLIPGLHHQLHLMIGAERLSWIIFLLSTAVQFGPAKLFYKSGWRALIQGSPNMNSLVMLGTSAAYGYSVLNLLFPSLLPQNSGHAYFEAAAVVTTLVLLGKNLEHIAKERTSDAVRKLVELQPRTALVIVGDNAIETRIEAIAVGNHVKVRPGDRVPLDGRIIGGISYIDESMITGESMPVEKSVNDKVIGGTINTSGSFVFEVTATGTETVLANIIRMVEDAQAGKPAIQALADKVVAQFVPAVLGLSLLTFLAWLIYGPEPSLGFAVMSAVAVLIIACPCAMGLATPTSIMVATGRGAGLGMLFRNPQALQDLSTVTVFAFDKTGTLTEGKPRLTDLIPTDQISDTVALQLVGSIEANSNHPIARAVSEALQADGSELLEVTEFEELPGRGLSAVVESQLYRIGSTKWMAELGYDLHTLHTQANRLVDEGKAPVYIADSHKILALFAVADALKGSSLSAISRLRNEGNEVVLISGDDTRVASAIANELGIDRVFAEVMPSDKAEIIRSLQAGGRKVAFVGDGINDAPALAQADVGIAMGSGTDVAIEAGDVVLLNSDLASVSNASLLSRLTIRNIKQNLFWAFAYNTVLIPVAAGALFPSFGISLNPILAAAAMGLSSVFVLGNALRLKAARIA